MLFVFFLQVLHTESRVPRQEKAAQSPKQAALTMAPPSPRGRPFPWKHAMILAWCQFTSAFSFAVLFPFVPFMIVDLGLVADSRSSGLYSGFLISASQLGKILTAYCWGSWSDRHGRKRVMYVGLAGISVAMLGFGLAGSFELACLARFLGGASDNIFGAAKTLLSESMEEEHQAKGMALLGSAWGFAIIFGPAVGGLLSRPALKYPAVFDPAGVFGVYPYLLPCCFTTGMAMVAMVLLQAVPETVGERAGALEPAEGAAPEEERETLLAEEDAGDASEAQPVDGADGADGGAAGGLALGEDGSGKIQRHWLLQRKPFLAVVTCGVMNCFVIADDDVMPLWAAAPRATGGLGLTTNQIGLMLGVIGVLLLACFTCFAPLDKAFGTLRAFQVRFSSSLLCSDITSFLGSNNRN